MNLRLDIRDFGRPINPKPGTPRSGEPPTEAPTPTARVPSTSIRRELLFGGAAFAVFVAVTFVWASLAEISGAVLAQGILVPETTTKKVQHQAGGIVREVLVENGSRVAAGDVLVRLDDTVAQANLAIISRQVDELDLRRLRLMAERDGAHDLKPPPEITARAAVDPAFAASLADEQRVLELRANAREGKRDQLRKRIEQTRQVIAGAVDQIAAKEREVAVIAAESESVGELFRKNLVNLQRVNQLIRDKNRIEGELAQLRGAKAEAGSRISEYELAILQIEQELRSEVASELREVLVRSTEARERAIAARDALGKTEIRAPQDGIAQQLAVHGRGTVVMPNEVVLAIVPTQERLWVDAQVPPSEIDQIRRGQSISLRFAASNARTSRTVEGRIVDVSPDRIVDPRDPRISFYQVRIGFDVPLDDDGRTPRLVPGMTVECYAATERRSVLSYVLKPLSDQAARAFLRS